MSSLLGSFQFKINSYTSYEYFILERDPIEVIKTFSTIIITKHIFVLSHRKDYLINDLFLFNMYNAKFLQTNDRLLFIYPRWKEEVEFDINLLVQYKFLTSRLANVIYKMATFRFYDSSTKIGRFYSEQFGMKSKTKQLPDRKPIKRVKVFDLKKIGL